MATPAHANSGGDGLVLWTAASGLLNAWTSEAENDVLALKEQAGCGAAAHRAWVANAKAMARTRVWPVRFLRPGNCARNPEPRPPSARAFQAPTTWRRRRPSEGACATPARAARWPARNAERFLLLFVFARFLQVKTSPPIASPATEYLYTSDEHHRLQGRRLCRSSIPSLVHKPARRARRQLTWIRGCTLACPLQPTGRGTLSGAGDLLAVHYKGSKPDDAFACSRTARCDCNPETHRSRWTCCQGAAEGDTQAQDAGGAVGRDGGGGGAAARAPAPTRGPAATRNSAQRWPQTFRCSAPSAQTLPRVIANHETRYAHYCGR